MKTLLIAFLLPLFVTFPSYAADVSVRLGAVKGSVWARTSPQADWVSVKDGVMLVPGATLKTGVEASAVLAFSDNNKVELGPKTTFAVEGASTLTTSLRLFSGRINAWVKRVNKANFVVRHSAGVASVRGTVFGMEGTDTGLKINLFEGVLDITDSFGRPSSMTPGQSAQMTPQTGLQAIASLPPDAKAPAEPTVEAPPAPKAAAPAPKDPAAPPKDSAPDSLPSDGAQAPSPVQESKTVVTPCDDTVSGSTPCPH